MGWVMVNLCIEYQLHLLYGRVFTKSKRLHDLSKIKTIDIVNIPVFTWLNEYKITPNTVEAGLDKDTFCNHQAQKHLIAAAFVSDDICSKNKKL